MASRCQAIEGAIEKSSTESEQTCASLQHCLEQMRGVEDIIKQADDVSDLQRQQEHLQLAKVNITAVVFEQIL